MEHEYLTSDEVIETALKLGHNISDRKLKYYVTLGIIAKPVRNPYGGIDGRVAYYHASVLQRIAKIKELQDSGFTLPQIKKYFENSINPELETFLKNGEQSQLSIESVMSALTGEDMRKAYEHFQKKIAAVSGSDDLLNEAGRDYYVEILSLLLGQEKAREYVGQFWLKAPEDLRKSRLDSLLPNSRSIKPGTSSSLSTLLLSICKQLRTGNFDKLAILDRLKELADKVHQLQEKYRLSSAPLKEFFDVSKLMRNPFWLYLKSLLEIESFIKDGEEHHLDRVESLSLKADEMLDCLEDLVSRTKFLLKLFSEAEQI